MRVNVNHVQGTLEVELSGRKWFRKQSFLCFEGGMGCATVVCKPDLYFMSKCGKDNQACLKTLQHGVGLQTCQESADVASIIAGKIGRMHGLLVSILAWLASDLHGLQSVLLPSGPVCECC